MVLSLLGSGGPASMVFVVATLAASVLELFVPLAAGGVVGAARRAAAMPAHPASGVVGAVVVLGALLAGVHVSAELSAVWEAQVRRRIDGETHARLRSAVAAPAGITHLEDPAYLHRVQLARSGAFGRTAGMAATSFTRVCGQYVTGVGGSAILATFSWPLAVLYFTVTIAARRRRQRVMVNLTAPYVDHAGDFRHADYTLGLVHDRDVAKEARIFGLNGWFIERYRGQWLTGGREVWRARGRESWRIATDTPVWLLPSTVLVAAVVHSGFTHGLAVSAVVSYLSAVQLVTSMGYIGPGDGFVNGRPALTALFDLGLVTRPSLATTQPSSPDHKPVGSIAFDGVSFRYPGSDRQVFGGLDLTIQGGACTAIVGVNGAGKSTLVNLLAGLYPPSSGRILIDGEELDEARLPLWRSQLAIVFQEFTRFPLTAHDNIAFGAHGSSAGREAVRRAADQARIGFAIDALPRRWDTLLSPEFSGGKELSGGQWQRLAVARALLRLNCGADVLVLDEPTANLDVNAEAELVRQVMELRRGSTTILVSHRFSTIRRADRIVVLGDGGVIEDGTHDELCAADGQYARLFELQAARFRDAEETQFAEPDADDEPVGAT